jgi:peptide/nickel transport system ATP-binding protein
LRLSTCLDSLVFAVDDDSEEKETGMAASAETATGIKAAAGHLDETVLAVRGLVTSFRTDDGIVRALDGVGFEIKRGRTLGIVGESGCGKSVTSLSIMRLLPMGVGSIDAGTMMFGGKDLATLDEKAMRAIRGNRIAMIFQEPMTALNPVFTAGDQIMEVFMTHRHMNRHAAREAALKMMEKVRIPDPVRRLDEYPHQMSGGMKQRVMIAMALACEPALIIADEPTTALDVTIQAQILRLMQDLQRETGTSIMFITHDLGVIAEIADDVVVMYAGQVIERAAVQMLFDQAMHPYTKGLLSSIPRGEHTRDKALPTIGGTVPSLKNLPQGCRFYGRCKYRQGRCINEQPTLTEMAPGHVVACHFAKEIASGAVMAQAGGEGGV